MPRAAGAAYQQTHLDPDEQRTLPTFLAEWRRYQDTFRTLVASAIGGDAAGAARVYSGAPDMVNALIGLARTSGPPPDDLTVVVLKCRA